ncbi:MAG: hypothetical protein ACW98D_12480 [Promethearchaeota archaeon]|jgi:hypothetical protein
MPYIISYVLYPPTQSNTVAQRYLEMLQKYPLPSIIKRLVPAAVASSLEGVEGVVVDEVKREDLGDAIDYNSQFLTEFRDIEGFRYHVRTYSTVTEALNYIGMG